MLKATAVWNELFCWMGFGSSLASVSWSARWASGSLVALPVGCFFCGFAGDGEKQLKRS